MSTSAKHQNDFFTRLPGRRVKKSTLPHCKADGLNFVLYRDRFVFAADAAGLSHILDPATTSPAGTKPTPIDPQNPTQAETETIEKCEAKERTWKSEQAILKQAIASTIPDPLFLKVKGEMLASGMWRSVKAEFETRSKMMTVDLRRKLQDERCTENGDVKAHLANL